MQTATDYITEDKKQALLLELEDLRGPRRKKILEALEYAKSLGDLSENAEYHQAREDQGKLEERIAKIEEILRTSHVVSGKKTKSSTVDIGSTVVVEREGKKDKQQQTRTYIIVGSEEANMAEGKISHKSPIGQALFGKKKGDKVSFNTPGGMVSYKIVSVA